MFVRNRSQAHRWIRWIVLAVFASCLLLLIWSAIIEPRRIVEEEYAVTIPGLPPEWEGAQVALIADPQVGMWLSNTRTLRRIITRLVKRRPAAVFIAGDFIYQPLPQGRSDTEQLLRVRYAALHDLSEVAEILQPLCDAGIPTYAVLGNHDYASSQLPASRSTAVKRRLEHAGVTVLIDEAVALSQPSPACSVKSDDSVLWLVGLSARATPDNRTQAALAQVPSEAARVVVMHNPETFEELPAGAAPLAMAGHTHGGQIRFPFLLLCRILGKVHSKPRPISGWITNRGQPGNRLYVNRGIGFSRLPLRFNAPPEITVFTLRQSA